MSYTTLREREVNRTPVHLLPPLAFVVTIAVNFLFNADFFPILRHTLVYQMGTQLLSVLFLQSLTSLLFSLHTFLLDPDVGKTRLAHCECVVDSELVRTGAWDFWTVIITPLLSATLLYLPTIIFVSIANQVIFGLTSGGIYEITDSYEFIVDGMVLFLLWAWRLYRVLSLRVIFIATSN